MNFVVRGLFDTNGFFQQCRQAEIKVQPGLGEDTFPCAFNLHIANADSAEKRIDGQPINQDFLGTVAQQPVLQSFLDAQRQQNKEQHTQQEKNEQDTNPGSAKERQQRSTGESFAYVHKHKLATGSGSFLAQTQVCRHRAVEKERGSPAVVE